MRTLIENITYVYTPDPQSSYGSITELAQAKIIINDAVIEKILFQTEPIPKNIDKIIDAGGGCVLPGFVDAHTHPVFWKSREHEFIMRIKGKSYEEIAAAGGGIRNSARSFQQAGKAEIKVITRNRIQKFLEYGTTTIEAKSGYGLSTRDEIKALQIIDELNQEQELEMVPTFLGAHEVPDAYQDRRQEYIDLVINEMIPQVAEQKLAKYCDVFCEQGVFTVAETRKILTAAQKSGLQARLHADELSAFGGAELAAEMRAVTADHLVKISPDGISAMAEAQVIALLLPVTTFFLRKDVYAPARKMIDAGCMVGIATDFNPGSAMTQNMQLAWSIAALKLGMLPGELLWATTYLPAKSLQLDGHIGTIEAGKQADLVILDIPNLDYLPYHLGMNHVHKTIKRGQIVYDRRI